MTTDAKSHSSIKGYLLVFFWLTVFTGIEIAMTKFGWSRPMLATGLIATALVKASLVAYFFMHLRFEGKVIYFMILFPGAIAILFILLLFPDIVVHNYWT